MRLEYVSLSGFRGHRDPLRVDFGSAFTVIDGRNGVGKSTLFDAVEFALTGTISKYGTAKADRESVDDYIWWQGEPPGPVSRYVEVGFVDGEGAVAVRRTPASEPSSSVVTDLLRRLCDLSAAPEDPLPQLCNATILRDERIAALSLDLNESERYALLRDAIGATDATTWIERASRIRKTSERRTQEAQEAAQAAADRLSMESQRLDGLRKNVSEAAAVSSALERLQTFTGTRQPVEGIADATRHSMAQRLGEVDALKELLAQWSRVATTRGDLPRLRTRLGEAMEARQAAEVARESLLEGAADVPDMPAAASLAAAWADLLALGERVGTQDERCPLCQAAHSDESYSQGVADAKRQVAEINQAALQIAQFQRAREDVTARLAAAIEAEQAARVELAKAESVIAEFEQKLSAGGLSPGLTETEFRARLADLEQRIEKVRRDLHVIESTDAGGAVAQAARNEANAKAHYARMEERLGRARRTEGRAQAFHDAARRSAAEALNQRLERVLPLMVELYHRLRPHPVWSDIEYRIRGDVRRFLRLQVGDNLNPQFMFSSGQRRATGLAFLFSVNMSLAWSRWQTVLLDDPVQHIDDYRSVHLAELLAQLVAAGKQVICAVEDPALADLMCRRLAGDEAGIGRRVTLGPDQEGALSVLRQENLNSLAQGVLLSTPEEIAG